VTGISAYTTSTSAISPELNSAAAATKTTVSQAVITQGETSAQSTDQVTLSSEGVDLSKSVEATTAKQESVGVLPPPDIAAFEADAALPRAELYAKYEKAVASLYFETQAALDRANAEVPKSDDPARLAQAKQATAYALNKGPSPFPVLSRNELAAIYYDYSGRYTSNERIAAVKQMNEMDKQFWDPLVSMASATGDQRAVLEAGLAAYDAALPIEKMKSPANYKQLTHQELVYFNNKAGHPIDEKKRETLLEMLDALYKKQNQSTRSKENLHSDQTGSWSGKLAEVALNSPAQ
jgi:hypothetical protein